jgi:hypothetical protein
MKFETFETFKTFENIFITFAVPLEIAILFYLFTEFPDGRQKGKTAPV